MKPEDGTPDSRSAGRPDKQKAANESPQPAGFSIFIVNSGF